MAQVKKTEVRQALLDSAFRLFSSMGYQDTTLARIASEAGVSTANVYVYFRSKLEILFAIYDPWLRQRILLLEEEAAKEPDPRRRLKFMLRTLWQDLPAEHNGFANNVMQAISGTTSVDGYRPTLLRWVETRIAAMVRGAIPAERRRALKPSRFAHVLMMAFDGFVINYHLNPGAACTDETVGTMVTFLLGPATGASPRRSAAPQTKRPVRRRHRG